MRGHRRIETEGLPDNANPNAVDGLLRAEMARMKLKFFRRRTVKGTDSTGRPTEIIEQVDTSAENIAVIQAHVAEPTGGDPVKGEDKHWRLSTLRFLVDGDDNITHYICARD